MLHRILGAAFLAAGLLYAAVILFSMYREREKLRAARGSLPLAAVMEVLVYFCASLGISDYILNTLLARHGRYTEDRELPGTLVACGLVPGAVLAAASLLRAESPAELWTLVPCGAAVVLGSLTGARLVGRFDGEKLRRIMRAALIVSFLILLARTLLASGAAGTAAGLHGAALWIAAGVCFLTGVINMFGIPMKPTWTAMFLLMGMSPLATLTLVLVIGSLSPLTGGISVLRRGVYHRKLVLCAVTFGAAGAVLGTLFAVSVPAVLLNVLLLLVMLLAIITMFQSK